MIIHCFDNKGYVQRFYSSNDANKIKELHPDLEIRTDLPDVFELGTHINEYDPTTKKLKSLEQRVEEGYVIVSPGFKINGEEIVEKTLKDKIEDGDIVMNDLQKYDPVENKIVGKTDEELYEDKIIPLSEYLSRKKKIYIDIIKFTSKKTWRELFSNYGDLDIVLQQLQANKLMSPPPFPRYPEGLFEQITKTGQACENEYMRLKGLLNDASSVKELNSVMNQLNFPTKPVG